MSYDDDLYGDVNDECRSAREGNPWRSRSALGKDAGLFGVCVVGIVVIFALRALWNLLA